MGKNRKIFFIYIGGGLAAAILVAWSQGLFSASSSSDILRSLCDGSFVVAALFLAYGGLRWTYNGGAMDGLGYSVRSIFRRMRFSYEDQDRGGFAEYRANREKKAKSPKILLLSGLVFLVISLVIYGLYLRSL